MSRGRGGFVVSSWSICPRPRTQEMRYSTEFTDIAREIHHWMVSENDRAVA